MEDAELRQKLDELNKKIDATFVEASKARKYLMWTAIVSIVVFVLPLIGLLFAIPTFISTYSQISSF